MNALKRRDFLRASAAALGVGVLAACQPKIVEVEKVITKEVEKVITKEVEKVVKETVIIAGTPQVVEKVVKETVVVEKIVEKEVPAPAEPKKMVLWGLKYDPHIARYEAMARNFEEQKGIEVIVQPQDDPFGKPLVALAAGNPPDVACVMGKALTPYLVKSAVVDLTDVVYNAIGADLKKDWFGDGIPCYTWEGKIYGVPTEVSTISPSAAWPTHDLPEAEAEQYPPLSGKLQMDSYEQMWELAQKLQIEKEGKVVRYGISSAGWEYSYFTSILAQLDRKFWDPDNRVFDFANGDSVTAFKLIAETPVKMGIEAEQGDIQTNLAQAGKVAIARGNCAMMFFMEEIDIWFEAFAPPSADPTKPNKWMGEGGWGFITMPLIKNPEAAIEFLRWTATFEGQKSWLEAFILNYIEFGPMLKTLELPMYEKTGNKYRDVIIDWRMMNVEQMANQTFFGGMYGYIGQCEAACSSICSEIRQGTTTSEEGAERMQELATNQYEQWQADIKAKEG